MAKKRLVVTLGVRPDVIRACLILDKLRSHQGFETNFIWSGQHYSENLKDIFFRQLKVSPPDIELNARGSTDAALVASIIQKLYIVLKDLRPDAALFLGDTNTVMGCLAAAQLNIPIIHIEGCMRSYDWRMPEEKYRVIIDHLSDVIYAYLDEYKQQGVREGLNPDSIVVTGNPIVDVLYKYYFPFKKNYQDRASDAFFRRRQLTRSAYYLMTCHRRENVEDQVSLENILTLAGACPNPVYFPASYRTQRMIKARRMKVPKTVMMVDPVGYEEFLILMTHSLGVLTDSGTVAEEACILQVPCVQLRKSTERPQVYDVGACVKFDPTDIASYSLSVVYGKLEALRGRRWSNPFGDGNASERITSDIVARIESSQLTHHRSSDFRLSIAHAFRDDALDKMLGIPTTRDIVGV